jgi:hypothetical protein
MGGRKSRSQHGRRRVADMSLPPEERGRKAKKAKRSTPKKVVTPPAQMDHGNHPRRRKDALTQAARQPRPRKKGNR